MIQLLNYELIDQLEQKSTLSARLRTTHNFHSSMEDNPHRFLNILSKGTYITPHRHLYPPKSESFLILDGRVAFILFDETGNVTQCYQLDGLQSPWPKSQNWGIDLEPGLWHTLICLSSTAVCYEIKPGPYKPRSDKEFAPWAPKEGSEGTDQYLKMLEEEFNKLIVANLKT